MTETPDPDEPTEDTDREAATTAEAAGRPAEPELNGDAADQSRPDAPPLS